MRSLNARVTVGAGLVLAVFIALSAFALERAFRDSARSARQERLLAQVYLLMAAAEVDAHGKLTLSNNPIDPRLAQPESGLYAVVTDRAGNALWQSHSSLAVETPRMPQLQPGEQRFARMYVSEERGFFVQSYGVSWATAGGSLPFTFSVAEDLQPYRDQINVYRRNLWGWLGAMALLLLVAQSVLLRWGLSPLRLLADELTRVERGEQDQIGGRYPSELTRLTDNLNTLMTHERARQKRYRDALADLAHSLKTPLAVVRSALKQNEPEADLARNLHEQVERMDHLVGYHLQRAATSGRSNLVAPLAVRPVVERLAKATAKVRADKVVQTAITVDPSLRFRGDEGDFMEILGNVLDNACKWCRSQVRVSATLAGDRLAITIEDDGPGIASEDAERVLQRGVRADQSTPGHGIGLAVTRDIVDAYDGRIVIERSPLGGAAVTLMLPGLA